MLSKMGVPQGVESVPRAVATGLRYRRSRLWISIATRSLPLSVLSSIRRSLWNEFFCPDTYSTVKLAKFRALTFL